MSPQTHNQTQGSGWGTVIGVFLFIVLTLTIGWVSLTQWNARTPAMAVLPPSVPASPIVDIAATQEARQVQEWMAGKEAAYCGDTTKVRRWQELQLCPDYIAWAQLTGPTINDRPIVHNPPAVNGRQMITLTPVYNAANRSPGWFFLVRYDASVFPAGRNAKFRQPFAKTNRYWWGPFEIGVSSREFRIAGDVEIIEVYGADHARLHAGQPLGAEKLGQ